MDLASPVAQDLTSPVAANQFGVGTFVVVVKMATQDLASPVAAIQLAAGAFFSENGHPRCPLYVHVPKPFRGDSELPTVNREQHRRSQIT